MNDNAKKWVEALRSGEYEQAQGHLRVSGGYCCLGVACDLYAQDHADAKWDGLDFRAGRYANSSHLPRPVQDWLGLATDYGDLAAGQPLTDRNDSGATFEEIADIIEVEPEGLFT